MVGCLACALGDRSHFGYCDRWSRSRHRPMPLSAQDWRFEQVPAERGERESKPKLDCENERSLPECEASMQPVSEDAMDQVHAVAHLANPGDPAPSEWPRRVGENHEQASSDS